MKIRLITLIVFIHIFHIHGQNRWKIQSGPSITWNVAESKIPHADHIEMAGLQMATVLRYGVDATGQFELERSLVWPMLRTIPNNTHASLMRRNSWNIINVLMVNGRKLFNEKVESVSLDGTMTVVSELDCHRNGNVQLTRIYFPSTTYPLLGEIYEIKNTSELELNLEMPDSRSMVETDPSKGVDGAYRIETVINGVKGRGLKPGETITFTAYTTASRIGEKSPTYDIIDEWQKRKNLVAEFQNKLVLKTPDPVINTMFAFSKIRAAESIYATKGGLLHGPGGESYYAAIWANDQAEYINPYFPFLGYQTGNESAINAYRHFARFMNPEYKPIPSSIIAEGLDIWDGAGDRGDAAMIAYGASRFALEMGDKDMAAELWPLIEWCLEFCKRKINQAGVVTSDSDELEGRFPSGDANLCTSSLYYDALLSSAYLAKELGKPSQQVSRYRKEARELKKAIHTFFGYEVEGFQTYRYYEGNDVLRSWICVPLTVGLFDRKEGTIQALFSPRLWTPNGLLTQAGTETFWDRSTLYALRGVFAAGETNKAAEYLSHYSTQRLLGEHVPYAIEAWPEGSQRHLSAESALYGRIFTEGILGIRPTGLRTFDLCPRLPQDWDYLTLEKIYAFGGKPFDIKVTRVGKKLKTEVIRNGKIVLRKTAPEGTVIQVDFS